MTHALLVLLLLGAETPAMRCGDLLVTAGANKLDVLTRCGEPAWRERVSGADEPLREVWIYEQPDAGAQKLLHFEGVSVVAIHHAALSTTGRSGSDGLRCGNALMQPGETKVTVLRLCGEPDLIDAVSGEEEPTREVWLYRRADGSVELHFSGVQLTRIERTPR